MKIGHVHLKIRNLKESIAFYQKFLDMKVTEQIGETFAFLSAGKMHHELALQDVGRHAETPKRHDVGLYHVAFEVPDKKSLIETYQRLQNSHVDVHPVNHRISWAIYFNDPDGNGIEVYWDTRDTEQGVAIWEGVDRPLTESQLS